MSRDIDHAFDEGGQWTAPGRERYERAWERSGSAKGRRRRQVIPAYSNDGEE